MWISLEVLVAKWYSKCMTMLLRISISILVIALAIPQAVLAQTNVLEGLAEYVPIPDAIVRDGDIIVLQGSQYRLADTPYHAQLFGVVQLEPAVALNVVGNDETYPLVSQGTVHVNVSTINGPIDAGQLITSSLQPGVGMLATEPGLVLGRALKAYQSDSIDEVGQIPIVVGVFFATILDGQELLERSTFQQVQDLLVAGAAAVVTKPNQLIKYFIAAAVALISVLMGFFVFGRSAVQGVVSVGRNPLARKSILLAVSFNIFLTVVFTGAGLAAAFFILAT